MVHKLCDAAKSKQDFCKNCNGLYFKWLNTCGGKFCSLDCKTNFTYMKIIIVKSMLNIDSDDSDEGDDSDYTEGDSADSN